MSAQTNVDKVVHDVQDSVQGKDRPMEHIDNRSPFVTIALPYFMILAIAGLLGAVVYFFLF